MMETQRADLELSWESIIQQYVEQKRAAKDKQHKGEYDAAKYEVKAWIANVLYTNLSPTKNCAVHSAKQCEKRRIGPVALGPIWRWSSGDASGLAGRVPSDWSEIGLGKILDEILSERV